MAEFEAVQETLVGRSHVALSRVLLIIAGKLNIEVQGDTMSLEFAQVSAFAGGIRQVVSRNEVQVEARVRRLRAIDNLRNVVLNTQDKSQKTTELRAKFWEMIGDELSSFYYILQKVQAIAEPWKGVRLFVYTPKVLGFAAQIKDLPRMSKEVMRKLSKSEIPQTRGDAILASIDARIAALEARKSIFKKNPVSEVRAEFVELGSGKVNGGLLKAMLFWGVDYVGVRTSYEKRGYTGERLTTMIRAQVMSQLEKARKLNTVENLEDLRKSAKSEIKKKKIGRRLQRKLQKYGYRIKELDADLKEIEIPSGKKELTKAGCIIVYPSVAVSFIVFSVSALGVQVLNVAPTLGGALVETVQKLRYGTGRIYAGIARRVIDKTLSEYTKDAEFKNWNEYEDELVGLFPSINDCLKEAGMSQAGRKFKREYNSLRRAFARGVKLKGLGYHSLHSRSFNRMRQTVYLFGMLAAAGERSDMRTNDVEDVQIGRRIARRDVSRVLLGMFWAEYAQGNSLRYALKQGDFKGRTEYVRGVFDQTNEALKTLRVKSLSLQSPRTPPTLQRTVRELVKKKDAQLRTSFGYETVDVLSIPWLVRS